MPESSHIERARRRLADQARARDRRFEALRLQAVADAGAIVQLIAERYDPDRIYQWGSVLRPGGFREYSDIDIAVEGVTDPEAFFAMLRDAEAATRYPVDLVQIEKIAPEYAEDIRRRGKVVYERQGSSAGTPGQD